MISEPCQSVGGKKGILQNTKEKNQPNNIA